VRHQHPGNGYGPFDSLYVKNQLAWCDDLDTYIARKSYPYDWTILIATIPGRDHSLQTLLSSIRDFSRVACPDLRIKITLGYDARVLSIGAKRQQMLEGATGKYVSFIDDDDRVTREYFEDAYACIRGGFDCCRLRGKIASWTFTHSIANKLDQPMANETTFLRPPNHLNVMKADIAKTTTFTDAVYGEDLDWTIRLARTGFVRTEYQPDESRIHYIYELGDRGLSPEVIERQRRTTHEQMLPNVLTSRAPAPVSHPEVSGTPQLRLGSRGFVRT
jgi:glycosyltransferase involved in cell wall biosynthesis